MWTRAQLKEKAKEAFRRNYWKMVLVSVIMTLIAGGIGSAGTTGITEDIGYEADFSNVYGDAFPDEADAAFGEIPEISEEMYEQLWELLATSGFSLGMLIGVVLIVAIVILVIAAVVGLLFSAYILNPIEVGCSRFFVQNLQESAEVKEVAFAFDHSYKNVVKVMFFRTLYTLLWSLLFVIPGIVKSYEYRMIPYLMAENPNLTKEQAFVLSKQMMMGQKWAAFVLDLSFIGWKILSACTLGILGVFYVEPYVNATNAALYEGLNTIYGHPAQNTYVMEPYRPVEAFEPKTEETELT